MTTREYKIRLSAQGRRQLIQYLNSTGKDGEKALQRIERGAARANKGLFGMEKGGRAAGLGLSVLVSQTPAVAGLARILGGTALVTGIVAIGTSSIRAAKDFQASMNRVQGITKATEAQMEKLEGKARQLGATTIFTATNAADAIEMLAKNGIRFQQIMDGALDATLALAGGLGGDLASSADLVTDIMSQFGLRAADLPRIADLVTGAALNSKFGFDDLRLAIGQAGGVAGKFGVDIDDFVTAVAASAPAFSSGQDAGTSFKTFLMRLTPQSKEAAAIMRDLGMEFFDAQGNMKSMGEIAQVLQDSLKDLSEEARNDALRQIFGTDAIRAALTLAEEGAEGFRELKGAINEASAAEQAAVRLKGLEGALRELHSAWEALQLTAADEGGLDAAEGVVRRLTDAIRYLNENFDEVNEVVERVATALAVILVGRGLNFAIARTAALGAAYVEMATQVSKGSTAVAGGASRLRSFGVAARVATAALGGPAGLIITAGALAALAIDLDATEDRIDDASTAAGKGATALDRYRDATKQAANEQERLGDKTSEATKQILAQSRAEMQEALRELQAAQKEVLDDLDGVGFTNRNNFDLALSRLEGASRLKNPLLEDLIDQIQTAKKEGTGLTEIGKKLEWLAGIGGEAKGFADGFHDALHGSVDELNDASDAMVRYAETVGGFDEYLNRISAAESGEAKLREVKALAEALRDAHEAGRATSHDQVQLFKALVDSSLNAGEKIDLLKSALSGADEFAKALENGEVDPFKSVADSAEEAQKKVDGLTLSMAEQRELYGQGQVENKRLSSNKYQGDAAEAAEKGLHYLVRFAEGTLGEQGYNTTLDYGKWTGGPINLTGRTLKEIREIQRQMLANPENRATYGDGLGSSALGAYQITGRTLDDLMKTLGLTGDEFFDEKMQDRLFYQLDRRRAGQGIPGLHNEWEGLQGIDDRHILRAQQVSGTPTVDEGVAETRREAAEKRIEDQKRERELIDALVQSGNDRAKQLEFEATLVGLSSEEQTRLRFVYEKVLEAKRQGINLDAKVAGSAETVRQAIEREAAAIAKLTEQKKEDTRSTEQWKSDYDSAHSAMESAWEKLRHGPQNIGEAFGDMVDHVSKKLWNLAGESVFDKIATNIADAFSTESGGGFLGFLGDFVGKMFGFSGGGSLSSAPMPALAGGGMPVPNRASGRVSGFGSKTQDNILLWGSRDEFMMNARAVDYYGVDFMDRLNKMDIPRRATGGHMGAPAIGGGSGPVGGGLSIKELHIHTDGAGSNDPEEHGEKIAEGFARQLPDLVDERIGLATRADGVIGQTFVKK